MKIVFLIATLGTCFLMRVELLKLFLLIEALGTCSGSRSIDPFLPTVAFSQPSSNICCPRDCVSRIANVGTVGKNRLRKKKILADRI